MEISIQDICDIAIVALREAAYKESTIYNFQKWFNEFQVFAEERQIHCYTKEAGIQFREDAMDRRHKKQSFWRIKNRNRCMDLLDQYIQTGCFDLGPCGKTKSTTIPLARHDAIRNAFLEHLKEDGKSKNTIGYCMLAVSKYLLFLEHNSVASLDAAGAETVFDFMPEIRSQWPESLHIALHALRLFFKFTGSQHLLEAANSIRVIRKRKVIPVLTDQEEQQLREAVNRSEEIPLRDRAITLLCLSFGLRACDIVALRISDINWRNDTISIIQKKTGNPLTLPLTAIVGNAMVDYLLKERPKSESDILFLRRNAPHAPLADHAACYKIVERTFRIAGILDKPRLCGTRVLRHNLASKLLKNEAPLETISAVLGHANPDSTNIYLSIDESRLRECGLPIPEIYKEVAR